MDERPKHNSNSDGEEVIDIEVHSNMNGTKDPDSEKSKDISRRASSSKMQSVTDRDVTRECDVIDMLEDEESGFSSEEASRGATEERGEGFVLNIKLVFFKI